MGSSVVMQKSGLKHWHGKTDLAIDLMESMGRTSIACGLQIFNKEWLPRMPARAGTKKSKISLLEQNHAYWNQVFNMSNDRILTYKSQSIL